MRERIVQIGVICLIAGIIIGKLFSIWLIALVAFLIVVALFAMGRSRRVA